MWLIVDHTDAKKRLVFGTLDNEPVNDYGGKVKLGSQLALNYDNVREYKKKLNSRSSEPFPRMAGFSQSHSAIRPCGLCISTATGAEQK
jgi:hypothetical protein